MRRRDALKAVAAGAAALAAPRLARAAGAGTLVFAPQADLAQLDPVWVTAYVTRNHAFLVFDTLYGLDEGYTPRPQMVEGHRVEDDGKLWTLTLRPGLRFHDGTTARRCWRATRWRASVAGRRATRSARPC